MLSWGFRPRGAGLQMLCRQLELGDRIGPRGDEKEQESRWQEFWESTETIRVYAEEPTLWEGHFTTGLRTALT